MKKESAIAKYEKMMMTGQKITLTGNKAEKQSNALNIIRYIITDCLGWSPQDAMVCLTPEVAKAVHIDVLSDYLHLPPDLTKGEDYDYVVALAFPRDVQYDPTEKMIKMYRKIVAGEKSKFPKKYFEGNIGAYKANYLLLYVINENIPLHENDPKSLYELFANSPVINMLLKKWHIYDVCRTKYNNALDYLHDSLPESPQNNFFYKFYSFQNVYKIYEKEYYTEKRKASMG